MLAIESSEPKINCRRKPFESLESERLFLRLDFQDSSKKEGFFGYIRFIMYPKNARYSQTFFV